MNQYKYPNERQSGRKRDKNKQRRQPEERNIPVNKPKREKRWKEMYESGALEDDGPTLNDEDEFKLFDDDEEETN